MKLFVVAIGDAFYGITLYGTFTDMDSANEWADHHSRGDDWHVIRLDTNLTEKVD